jgi:hypothetical protein
LNAVRTNAQCDEIDRQGNPVQSTADVGHDRRVGILQFKRMLVIGDLFDEQLHRRKAQGSSRCQ